MSPRAVAVLAFALLAAIFTVDALTPQTLVVAILLDVPVVLAALTSSRRLTFWLALAALAADVAAAFVNAAHDGYRWDPLGVGDRALSMFSIVLVAYLSIAVQRRGERAGRLAAQEARARREASLAAAAERIRASLSLDLVTRAIVREAPRLLDGNAAFWYPADPAAERLTVRAGASEVEVLDTPAAPEIVSLAHRAGEDGAVTVLRAGDPLGGFALARLDAPSALAVPFVERGRALAVLFVTARHEFDAAAAEQGQAFATLALASLAQARLFDALADRNEALGERQAVIRDLVDAISHDVRTPLAALSMTLRQAFEGAYGPLPASYTSVLRDSLISIDDLQRLAETLLLVARFESGERRVERESVDLAALVREVGSEMAAMAASRGVALAVEAEPALTRGSRADLRRAIVNLAANALQHTPADGHVELRTQIKGTLVEVVVSDDGFGVEPALRGALFARAGSGLGLYIVRRIADESGGSVRYAPHEPRGAVFTIALPKAAA